MKSAADEPRSAAVPHLEGRTFVVTGPTSGIGRVTARRLAGFGARVVLAGRSVPACEALARELRGQGDPARIEVVALDLSALASVRAAATQLLERAGPIAGLINNAGLAGARGVTRDGFELAFGVNHLGPFLLTRLLEPRLRAGAPARVVNVASEAHRRIRDLDFTALREKTRTRTAFHEYSVSKLCNVLFARELARRWVGSGVTSYALHPGVVATDIWRHVPQPLRWLMTRWMVTPEQGAETTIYCATAPDLAGISGRYYDKQREARPNRAAQDDALAARLWDESERMVGLR